MKFRNAPSKCTSAGRVTAGMLLSFLSLSAPTTAYFGGLISGLGFGLGPGDQSPILAPLPAQPDGSDKFHGEKRFALRHIYHHGTYQYPELHRRKDIHPDAPLFMMSEDGSVKDPMPPLIARTQDHTIQRLRDRRPSVIDPMIAAAREQGEVWALSPSAWTIDNVAGPNITDKETVITLALMSSNAYVDIPYTGDWREVNGGFNSSLDFGWENDGLRGHVFADETNSTVVIGLKGTSLAVFDGAETTTGDKENDNLFFSCCCGQQGQWSWRQVCDCATSTFACNTTCVTKSLRKENRYYQAARELYSNVTEIYPDANIWLAGHSLGGSVSGLLGLTYGVPATTFEAPGEAMAASRLGLPVPPGSHAGAAQTREFTGAHHFGHTADPVYMGTCNGASSSCSFAGYAMESVCHTGWTCEYDVVGEKGWRVSITTHRIHSVIDDVLKMYDNVAECKRDSECVDCFNWKFFESNGTEGTTTSSSTTETKTRTRTETCKTPGWWGCLDETATTSQQISTSSTTTTTTSSTSTCKTPGWFGCRDEVTTTSKPSPLPTVTTTSQPTPKPTTTCTSPGFFGGCNDPTSTISISTTTCATPGAIWGCKDATTSSANTITSPPTMPTPTHSSTTTTEHTCTSKEWFGLICVDPSPTNDPEYRKKKHHCVERSWLGFCKAYDSEPEEEKKMRAYEI